MKRFWLHSLLKVYATTMFILVGFVALLISYASWQTKVQEASSISQRVVSRTVDEVEYYHQRSRQLIQDLFGNSAKLEGVYKYFSLSPSAYASWKLQNALNDVIKVSLHDNINDIYFENSYITGIDIALQDYKMVFTSSRSHRGGVQILASSYKPSENAIPIPIYDTANQMIGTAYMTIDSTVFNQIIDNVRNDLPLLVKITSPYNQVIFQTGEGLAGKWIKRYSAHDYVVEVALPKDYLREETVRSTIFILGVSLILTASLYVILQRVFRNYQRQVVDVVETIQAIGQGASHLRIDTATKEQELLLIADNTNTMLDNLDRNIHDIYQLQLNQKDANMRALQAQINPHFMYNTLEFIRMYAVMKSQDELADIIYEFSSLLRNNISDETQVTLESELEFCRKYSYLCMVRHPNSVAYGFTIAEELKKMVIPKFTIQPLVENYFAHGVDYRRKDNVISVKVLKMAGTSRILIQDNGRGIKAEKLAEIRHILSNRQLEASENKEKRTSIGIINIHERFLLFFGDRYSIAVDSEENKGVRYIIEIKDK
mgnify:FL=1